MKKEQKAQIPFPERSQWPNLESANNNSDLMSDRNERQKTRTAKAKTQDRRSKWDERSKGP